MAQGKLKIKTKCPPGAKHKKKPDKGPAISKRASAKQKKKPDKGPAISKRANRPIKPKKNKNSEANKFKKMVTKTVNKAVEEEIRNRAAPSHKLSKIQEAIAKQNRS